MPAKKPRKRAASKPKKTSLTTRKRLLTSLIEGVLEHTSPQESAALCEHLMKFGIARFANHLGVDPDTMIVLTPTDMTTRLVNAIAARAEATGESGDKIINALIATLGPEALIFLPN